MPATTAQMWQYHPTEYIFEKSRYIYASIKGTLREYEITRSNYILIKKWCSPEHAESSFSDSKLISFQKKKHTPVQKIIYSTSLMQEGVFSLVYARVLMFLKTTSWIILELKRLQNYNNYWVMYGHVFTNQLVGHSNLGIGRIYFWWLSPKYMLWFSECFNHHTCSCK